MKLAKSVDRFFVVLILGFGVLFAESQLLALSQQTQNSPDLQKELSGDEEINDQNSAGFDGYMQLRVDTRILQTRSQSEIMFKKMSKLAHKKLGSSSHAHDLQATLSVILRELTEQP